MRTKRSAARAWERLVSLNLKGYGYRSYKFEKKYARFPNQKTTQTEDRRTTRTEETEETRIPGSASRPLPGSSPERKRERNRRTWYGHIRNQEVRIRTVSMGEPWYMWYMGLVCLLFLAASVCLLFLTEETQPLHCKPAHLDFHFREVGFQPLELVSDLVHVYQFWSLHPVRRRHDVFPTYRQSLPERWREGRLLAAPLIAATVSTPPSLTYWTIQVPDVRRGVTDCRGIVVTLGDTLLRPDQS